jgi:Fur family transcriptional regulator, ferric uptake regulator
MTSASPTQSDPRRTGLTKGAQKVLELLEQSHELSSAQDIHGRLRSEEDKPPGLTTVYRSLESLVQLGLVQAVDFGDGERRYEVVAPGEHHHHLVCRSCRSSTHLDSCLVEDIEDAIRAKYKFRIDSHIFEVFGVCDDCAKKSKK